MEVLLIRSAYLGGVEASLIRKYRSLRIICATRSLGVNNFGTIKLYGISFLVRNISLLKRVHIIGLPMLIVFLLVKLLRNAEGVLYLHDSKISRLKLIVIWIFTICLRNSLTLNFPNIKTSKLYKAHKFWCKVVIEKPAPFMATNVKDSPINALEVPDKFCFSIIGRCSAEKRPNYAIDLLNELSRLSLVSNVRFYGSGWSEWSSQLNSPHQVLGQIEMSDQIFLDSDVVLCCSEREAYGLVQIETVLANCILFSTSVGIVESYLDPRKILKGILQIDSENIKSVLCESPSNLKKIVFEEKTKLLNLLNEE